MNLVFRKKTFKCGTFLAILFLFTSLTPTFAANPSAPFSPSANVIDPNCLPTDSNCYVSMANMTFTSATTSKFSVVGNVTIMPNEGFESNTIGSFTTSGGTPWSATSSSANSGTYSVMAGVIPHSSSTSLILTKTLSSDASISFSRRVSSEGGYDYLKFYIDGVLKDSWSGEVAWGQVSYPVTIGTHTFTWEYSKDSSATSGSDTAWVDDIVINDVSSSLLGVFLSGSSIFNINALGNIGIGTTTPSGKLAVVGSVSITGNLTTSNLTVSGDIVGNFLSKGASWVSASSSADNSWSSVTYGNGLFVAVAYSGTGNRVMTSTDGINWTSRTSAADNNWRSIVYGNGLFVAVASTGTGNRVMTSPDGVTWTSRTSPADNNWYEVTYGNGLFVAVASSGTGNRVMTSPDGITWTSRTSAADNQWISVTYGNGLFVAVANTGTGDRVMTSPDGITWTIRTSAADNGWTSIVYGNGMFVAVAESGTNDRVMTSPDGITWTLRTSATGNNWRSVTYGNGLFVAVSSTGIGDRVMTSLDGITWTSRTSAADNQWYGVTYGNGMFVAVAQSGTGNRVMTSGKLEYAPFSHNNTYQGGMNIFGLFGIGTSTPSKMLSVQGNGVNDIAEFYNGSGSSILKILNNGNIGIGTSTPTEKLDIAGNVKVSGDILLGGSLVSKGVIWTSRTSAADYNWFSVTYGNGLFVAVGGYSTGNDFMTSPDGINWTIRTTPSNFNNWLTVTYGNGLFVAGSSNGSVMTSSDGITWTLRTTSTTNSLSSITYGNGTFVALVGTSSTAGAVITSLDGITWTSRTSAAGNFWNSVTYGNGLFVAVSTSGTGNRVMSSPDGITWTSRTSAADNYWTSITYGNGLFVAVANTGTGNRVMTSPDGITWTSRAGAADNSWSSVTYGNGLFVAVSEYGTPDNQVMTSPNGITWTLRTSSGGSNWNSVTYGNGMFVAVTYVGTSNRVMTSGKPDTIPFSANNTYQGGMKIFGNVSIGTSTSPYALAVGNSTISGVVSRFQNSTGYCDINPTTTSLTCTSDERLKKNILDIGSTTLDKLTKLRPVTYNWLSESSTSSPHAGLIAQEVESLFPDLVSTDDSGTKSVAYGGFIPYILEGMKSIAKDLRDVVTKIASFRNKVDTNTICLGEDGNQTCITKSQLDVFLQSTNQSSAPQTTQSSTLVSTTTETVTVDTFLSTASTTDTTTSSSTTDTASTTTIDTGLVPTI